MTVSDIPSRQTDNTIPIAGTLVDEKLLNVLSNYMQFSAVVYCKDVSLRGEWGCGELCGGVLKQTQVKKTFKNPISNNGLGIVAVNTFTRSIVVVFRGTGNNADWKSNLRVYLGKPSWIKTPWRPQTQEYLNYPYIPQKPEGVKVHYGYNQLYLSYRIALMTEIDRLMDQYPGFDIVFTGHSLGGAMASICAADFIYSHGNPKNRKVSLITYGQPRSGNRAWARWMNQLPFHQVYRVTRDQDMVPRAPPMWIGYRHFSQEITINEAGYTIYCQSSDDTGETNNCAKKSFRFAQISATHRLGYYWPSGCSKKQKVESVG
ncbi:hypothetical protein BDV3_004200 [Batrachochytrium dendrobatidis]